MTQDAVNPQEDRRVFERISNSLTLRLIDLDTNKELEAHTYDISAKGLSIVIREYIWPWDRLELWLNMPDRKLPFYTRGTAVWSSLQGIGEYRIGISLEKAEFMGMSRIFCR